MLYNSQHMFDSYCAETEVEDLVVMPLLAFEVSACLLSVDKLMVCAVLSSLA